MPKLRDDFVWIRPLEGLGRVSVNTASLHITCTREEPLEVTKGEWEAILKRRGKLETCPPPVKGE